MVDVQTALDEICRDNCDRGEQRAQRETVKGL